MDQRQSALARLATIESTLRSQAGALERCAAELSELAEDEMVVEVARSRDIRFGEDVVQRTAAVSAQLSAMKAEVSARIGTFLTGGA